MEIRQILRGPQLERKLFVGGADDGCEREAHRVADAVVGMPEPDGTVCQEQAAAAQREFIARKVDGRIPSTVNSIIPEAVATDVAVAVHLLRDGGAPLDAGVRTYFEPRFGADFSAVRVHTDRAAAVAAQALRARAYTYGTHIVFAEGQYAPGSDSGKHLLAHELTHVLQQHPGSDSGLALQSPSVEAVVQREEAPAAPGETAETAFPSRWNGVLRGGALGTISSELLLIDLYGLDQADALADAIRADAEALAFVREYSGFNGARPVVALADTRRPDGSFDVPGARRAVVHLALAVLDARANRLRAERSRQADAESLAGLQSWAEARQRQQGVIDTASVVGLDPTQAQTLATLRSRLPALGTAGPQAAGVLNEVARGIHDLVEENRAGGLRFALSRLRSDDEIHQLEGRSSVLTAQSRLRELLQRMPEVLALVDVEDLAFALQDELRRLRDAGSGGALDVGAVEQVRDNLRALRRRFRETAATLGQSQASPRRLDFVLRLLLWLNGAPGATAPTAEESTELAGLLRATVEDDLRRLFPSLSRDQIQLLRTFGESILPRQLEARQLMQAAGQAPAGPVPTLAEGRAWFRSLRDRNNGEVVRAYEAFTEAWFYHRIEASIDDLAEPSIESLFERQASITGSRPLVCSGYALVGATLLQEAGAQFQRYVLAVRATDEQIRNNSIDAGHAIAILQRRGATLIVSNDSIVATENQAIGPTAVAWGNAQAPLRQANGATLAAAKRTLEAALSVIANP